MRLQRGDHVATAMLTTVRFDTVRCFDTHAEDDPAIGQPITPKKLGQRAAEDAAESARQKLNPGLEPETMVNTHRMLHRAWEDFTT